MASPASWAPPAPGLRPRRLCQRGSPALRAERLSQPLPLLDGPALGQRPFRQRGLIHGLKKAVHRLTMPLKGAAGSSNKWRLPRRRGGYGSNGTAGCGPDGARFDSGFSLLCSTPHVPSPPRCSLWLCQAVQPWRHKAQRPLRPPRRASHGSSTSRPRAAWFRPFPSACSANAAPLPTRSSRRLIPANAR